MTEGDPRGQSEFLRDDAQNVADEAMQVLNDPRSSELARELAANRLAKAKAYRDAAQRALDNEDKETA